MFVILFTGVSWKLCSCGVGLMQSVNVVTESCHNSCYIVCMNLPLQSVVFMNLHRIQSVLTQLQSTVVLF